MEQINGLMQLLDTMEDSVEELQKQMGQNRLSH